MHREWAVFSMTIDIHKATIQSRLKGYPGYRRKGGWNRQTLHELPHHLAYSSTRFGPPHRGPGPVRLERLSLFRKCPQHGRTAKIETSQSIRRLFARFPTARIPGAGIYHILVRLLLERPISNPSGSFKFIGVWLANRPNLQGLRQLVALQR